MVCNLKGGLKRGLLFEWWLIRFSSDIKCKRVTNLRAKIHPMFPNDEKRSNEDNPEVRFPGSGWTLRQVNGEGQRLQKALQLLW